MVHLCQADRSHGQLSGSSLAVPRFGRLHVIMGDGSEGEFGAGDVSMIPPGHDAWVVGNEPVVFVDISGLRDYAKP